MKDARSTVQFLRQPNVHDVMSGNNGRIRIPEFLKRGCRKTHFWLHISTSGLI